MTLYQHRFLGHTAAGELTMYSWWANSTRSLVDAQAAAVAWNATLWDGATAGNGYSDHTTADVGMDQVTTVTVNAATGLQSARLDTAQSNVGAGGATSMPADVALVVSLRTPLANRSGRGRFYLPPFDTASLTSIGGVAADVITDLGASLNAAWGTYNTATDEPVVYSRTLRTFTAVTSFDIGDLFDTQRRRENKTVESRTSTAMPG